MIERKKEREGEREREVFRQIDKPFAYLSCRSSVVWSSGCAKDSLAPFSLQAHPGYGPFALAAGGRLYAITMAHASMASWAPGEAGWRAEPAPLALDVRVIQCRFQYKRAQRYIRLHMLSSTFE